MIITFDKNKECTCYETLVNNETDRTAIKKFTREFNQNILSATLKTHKRLKIAEHAALYNLTSSSENKIELKSGTKNSDPLILKVRIQQDYRKFFYFLVEVIEETLTYCITKEWTGQFNKVNKIHVFAINKHDYKSV